VWKFIFSRQEILFSTAGNTFFHSRKFFSTAGNETAQGCESGRHSDVKSISEAVN
jgi:hypothetical protein